MEKLPLLEDKSTKPWRWKITIEPMTLIFLTGMTISQNLQINMMLDKACSVYNVERDYCESETDSELLISKINSWKMVFVTLFSVIFMSYVGPVIDRNPRNLRYILMIPILGQLCSDCLGILSAYFWNWPPAFMALYDAVFVGLSGSVFGFAIVAASFVSYTSSKKERTIRMGFLASFITLGLSLGYFAGGYVAQYLRYLEGYSLCVCSHILSIIVGIMCMKDTEILSQKTFEETTTVENIKQNFQVMTKKRENGKQLVIILSVIIYALIVGYPLGELSVIYLFLRRQFGWDAVEYGVFMSFKMIIKSLGALLCTEILKRRIKLHDATIGIIGCFLQVTMAVLWILLYYSWQVYAVTAIGLFERAISAVVMSLASKCVEPYEYGRLCSLFGLTYVVTPMLFLLYNKVYMMGIYTFPQAIFLISVCLSTPCLLVFGILRYFSKQIYEKEQPYTERIP